MSRFLGQSARFERLPNDHTHFAQRNSQVRHSKSCRIHYIKSDERTMPTQIRATLDVYDMGIDYGRYFTWQRNRISFQQSESVLLSKNVHPSNVNPGRSLRVAPTDTLLAYTNCNCMPSRSGYAVEPMATHVRQQYDPIEYLHRCHG